MSYESMCASQREWAAEQRIAFTPEGYTETIGANLFQSMNSATATDFGAASGGELRPGRTGRAPKMHALHSSSALACNVFDYWRKRDPGMVGRAFELSHNVDALRFEAQFPTGLPGEPPNIDVVLESHSGQVTAVECKFTEPFQGKHTKPPFKDKYFPGGTPIWSERGLPRSGELAAQVQAGSIEFKYLDAPQLLKHALGLQRYGMGRFNLVYLFMPGSADVEAVQEQEIARFRELLGAELPFNSLSYPVLISRLRLLAGSSHGTYFDYLIGRYLRQAAA